MKTIKRSLAVLLTLLMLIGVVPLGIMNAGAVWDIETSTAVRKNLVNYFHSMATIQWICGADFTVTVGNGSQTYYKGKTYYGFPYAQKKGSNALALEMFQQVLGENSGKVSKFIGQSDCSTSMGVVYKEYIGKINGYDMLWSPSEFTTGDFKKVGSVGDYSALLPGDVLVNDGHIMMVISVDKTNKKVKVTHQSSGFFTYDSSSDTTGNSQTTMAKRNCSWGVNQNKDFSTLKSGGYQGYRYKNLSDQYGATVTLTFNGNGGTPSKASETYVIGQEYGDAFPSATGKEGYSFDGWYTSASGGIRQIRSSLASSSVTKLYAHWIKNSANVLKVNHIYKIYNEKSKLPWQVNDSSSGSYVCQQEEKAVNGQLWRVTYADDNGYYKFESLCGLNALDMNANNKYGYRNHLQVYTPHGNDSQTFALVYRTEMAGTTGLYTIHSKNSGRVVNVEGASLNAGAELNQWDYHGYGQRFYFVENTDRRVNFYDNYNSNYLPSPKEVYDEIGTTTPKNHYSSRDTSYATVSINPTENSLIINQLKAGSTAQGAIAGDLKWVATLNGSYAFDISELNDSTMTLHFKAKSSVAGAKMHFRWGYTTDWYPVSLTTAWTEYTIDLPRDKNSGNNLHPVIDKACAVEIKDIAMYENGSTGYIGDTDTFSVIGNYYNINDATSCFTPLPTGAKEGYSFSGWYTKRVGGEKVADGNDYYDVSSLVGGINLYAHWTKDEVHTHIFNETVKAPTCTEVGYTTYICATCGNSYSDNYVNALGHDYQGTVTAPTCIKAGYTTYTCSRCGDSYVEDEVEAMGHNYVVDFSKKGTCTIDGYDDYICSHCGDSYREVYPALGHLDVDDNGYCDICSSELRPHDDSTNPTQSTDSVTEPTTPSPIPQNICKWCGGQHEGFFQGIIGFFHRIFAALFGAKY